MKRGGSPVVACALVALTTMTAGCEFTGAGSLPLPFRDGTGANAMTVTVEMASGANLVPNSEVKVGDVTVGTVTDIAFDDWRARLTVGLNAGTGLPANATAKVAQKSLLGATYLEMASPPAGTATGSLRNGDTIPVTSTGDYPSTEQVLASLSLVLNGGGLNQIKTISTEVNNALAGREGDWRGLIDRLNGLVGTLDDQTTDILAAIDGLDQLGKTYAGQRDTIAHALEEIPQGLEVLERNRADLTRTVEAVGELGTVANRVIDGTREDLLANLRDLQPSLARLADAGTDLTESLSLIATFPFPYNTAGNAFTGDYSNLMITLDVTAAELGNNFLKGSPLESVPALIPGQDMSNPLEAPLIGAVPGLAPPVTPQQNESAPNSPAESQVAPGRTVGGDEPPPTTSDPADPSRPSDGDGLLGGLLGGGR